MILIPLYMSTFSYCVYLKNNYIEGKKNFKFWQLVFSNVDWCYEDVYVVWLLNFWVIIILLMPVFIKIFKLNKIEQ